MKEKLFLAAIIFSVILAGCLNGASGTKITAPDKSALSCEVALTAEERERGLMNRSFLCPDCCMLFVFEKSERHSFWMKNTLIPLDLVFLSENFSVVDLKENFLPCKQEPCKTFVPKANAKYVVEANEGQARKRGLVEGGHASIS